MNLYPISLPRLAIVTSLSLAQAPLAANPFKEWDRKTVMVISPHPDDDIIGCGGALAFLGGRQNRLIAVFLTDGEKGTQDPSMEPEAIRRIRRREAAAAYRVLGFPEGEFIWLDYGDGELDFAPPRDVRVKVTQLIRRFRPDLVFALDPGATFARYHYRDHRTAALVSADAIGIAMWPLEHPELGPAFRVPEVFYFYTAEANLTLDISDVYNRKLDALAQHRSQLPPASTHYEPQGAPPARADLEATIRPLTSSLTTEFFRRR